MMERCLRDLVVWGAVTGALALVVAIVLTAANEHRLAGMAGTAGMLMLMVCAIACLSMLAFRTCDNRPREPKGVPVAGTFVGGDGPFRSYPCQHTPIEVRGWFVRVWCSRCGARLDTPKSQRVRREREWSDPAFEREPTQAEQIGKALREFARRSGVDIGPRTRPPGPKPATSPPGQGTPRRDTYPEWTPENAPARHAGPTSVPGPFQVETPTCADCSAPGSVVLVGLPTSVQTMSPGEQDNDRAMVCLTHAVERARLAGLCTRCFRRPAMDGALTCANCGQPASKEPEVRQ